MKREKVVAADESTLVEKVVVAMTGFGFACLAFVMSAVVLVPLTGAAAERFGFPEWLTGAMVMGEIFGLTAVAGLAGAVWAARRPKV